MIPVIFEEIAATSKPKEKLAILNKHKDNDVLKNVIYLALSPRIKFFIKKIPEYTPREDIDYDLSCALSDLRAIYTRAHRGDKAKETLITILSNLNAEDAKVVEKIIDGNLRLGFNESTANKVWKGLIEETPYMGASSYKEKLVRNLTESLAYSQIKMDGRYANMIIDEEGTVTLESRGGEITYLRDHFKVQVQPEKTMVLNGELTIPGIDRYTSNGIIASLVSMFKKEADGEDITDKLAKFEAKYGPVEENLGKIVYTYWDAVTYEEYMEKYSSVPYANRLGRVEDFVQETGLGNAEVIKTTYVGSFEEAMAHFQEMLNAGEEGTILKDPQGHWKDGKPKWQVKMKLEIDTDLVIVGFKKGEDGSRIENSLGSLLVQTSDSLLETSPAGISDEMRDEFWQNQDKYLGMIVTVTSAGLSQNKKDDMYALLHPRFNMLRDDKHVADSLETVKEIEAAAKGLR